jgi:hypothetical protein
MGNMNRYLSLIRIIGLVLIFTLYQRIPEIYCQERGPAAQDGSYTYFAEKLKDAENILQENYIITFEDLESLEAIKSELQSTQHQDLLVKSRMLLTLAEERLYNLGSEDRFEELSEMMNNEEEKYNREKRIKIARTVSITTTIVSFSLFNFFWYLSDLTYENYLDTSSQAEQVRLERRIGIYDVVSIVNFGVGVVSLGVSIPLITAGAADPTGQSNQADLSDKE